MDAFTLQLASGAIVTGLRYFPKVGSQTAQSDIPLIVAIHGGTYSATYFSASFKRSILPLSTAMNVPFLAINRPGHKETTPLPPLPAHSTFLQEEGKYLHQQILPAIWKEYASKLSIGSIVLMTHSLGAAGAIVAASLNAETKSYPLAGLIISGIGTETNKEYEAQIFNSITVKPPTMNIPNDVKDMAMLGSREGAMVDASIFDMTEVLQDVLFIEECSDIQTKWLDYWKGYAAKVDVPVLYGLADADRSWTASEQHMRDFAGAFEKSPRVESGLVLGAAHSLELTRVGSGWYARAYGFGVECAVAKDLKRF